MKLFTLQFQVDIDLEIAEYYLYFDRPKNKCYYLFDNTKIDYTTFKNTFDFQCRKQNKNRINL